MTPGCVAPNWVESSLEEPPPRVTQASGWELGSTPGSLADAHLTPTKAGKMAHTCWLGQPAFWAFRKFFRLWAASLPSIAHPLLSELKEGRTDGCGGEQGSKAWSLTLELNLSFKALSPLQERRCRLSLAHSNEVPAAQRKHSGSRGDMAQARLWPSSHHSPESGSLPPCLCPPQWLGPWLGPSPGPEYTAGAQ